MHISDESIVRSGWASVRDEEQVGDTWRRKWLLLSTQALSIHSDDSEYSTLHSIVKLGEVMKVERVRGKEPFRFELEYGYDNGRRRICVLVKGDTEICGWMNELTLQCSLARSMERERVGESSKRGWEFGPAGRGFTFGGLGMHQLQQQPPPPVPPPSNPLSSFDFMQGVEGFGDLDPSTFQDDLNFERDFGAWFNPDDVQLDLK